MTMNESQCPTCYMNDHDHWPAIDGREDMRAVCCDRYCLHDFDEFLDSIDAKERELLESELGPPKN